MSSEVHPEAGEVFRTPAYVAKRYNISPRTLQGWRLKGTGPRFILLTPKVVRYPQSGLDEHEAERIFASTSAESAVGE